jgi:hypothetical protein
VVDPGAPQPLSAYRSRNVIARVVRSVVGAIVGVRMTLPPELLAKYPELAEARWRRGGLPVRIGGWCLGRATVAGFTLGRTIWLAPRVPFAPELLLHELRHVHQFASDRAFPLRYVWRSLRHGYAQNPYETDARQFAASRVTGPPPTV